MGLNCWCCFCYCCRYGYCCRHFDEEEDIGSRGCCRYHDGEPMCPCECRFIKWLFHGRINPCGCYIRIHAGYIDIDWKNKVTIKQGLLFIAIFKLGVLLSLFTYCGVLERRYFAEWQQYLEKSRQPTGNQWRTKYYLSSTPQYEEDWVRRHYCCHALTTVCVLLSLIGDIFVLLGVFCRSMICCILYSIMSSLAAVCLTFYQPIEYYVRYFHFLAGRRTYKLWHLAVVLPLTLLQFYQLWIMIYFMQSLRNPYKNEVDVQLPTEDDLDEARVARVARDLAWEVAENSHLTVRDSFYPNENNSSYAVAERFMIEARTTLAYDRPEPVTGADLKKEMDK